MGGTYFPIDTERIEFFHMAQRLGYDLGEAPNPAYWPAPEGQFSTFALVGFENVSLPGYKIGFDAVFHRLGSQTIQYFVKTRVIYSNFFARQTVGVNGSFTVNVITGLDEGASLPVAFGLGQNYPNPFNPSTTISFTLAQAAYTTLEVYNVHGEEVTTLVSEELAVGTYTTQ